MSKKRPIPGEKSTRHILDRHDGGDGSLRRDLRKINLPGGGVAYSGPGATRALKALDARAMTLDRHIIVEEGFDPTTPEDAALYAHEKVHVDRGSTEAGAHAVHEAEEVAARAAEELVMQRMTGGAESPSSGSGSGEEKKKRGSAGLEALNQLLASGMSREAVMELVAKGVVDRLQEEEQLSLQRGKDTPGGSSF